MVGQLQIILILRLFLDSLLTCLHVLIRVTLKMLGIPEIQVNVTDSVIRSNEQRTADPLELSSLAQQEEQKD